QIRCLVRLGDTEGAIRTIEKYLASGRLRGRGNPSDRSIEADELLLELRLLKPQDPRFGAAAERLGHSVNDYTGHAIPSAQRLFLMDELREAHEALPNLAS